MEDELTLSYMRLIHTGIIPRYRSITWGIRGRQKRETKMDLKQDKEKRASACELDNSTSHCKTTGDGVRQSKKSIIHI